MTFMPALLSQFTTMPIKRLNSNFCLFILFFTPPLDFGFLGGSGGGTGFAVRLLYCSIVNG